MDLFDGVQFVRLRCCGRGEMYLAASGDRSGIDLLPDRSAAASVTWSVRATTSPDGKAAFLLRSVYGLYLATSSDLPVSIRPHDDLPPPPELRWQVVLKEGGLMIRNGVGRFLRGNGRYLQWRTAVTVTLDDGSSMLLWDMEVVQGPEIVATPRPSQEIVESKELFVRHKKDLLRAIKSERDERIGEKEGFELKMKLAAKKMCALTSKVKEIKKRETPQALSLALHRPLMDLEIAKNAYRAHDMNRIKCQARICSLNSQEAKTKKMIEVLVRSMYEDD